jgi:hypothetical protein
MFKTKQDFINKIHLLISVCIVVPVSFLYGFYPDLQFNIHIDTIDQHNFFKAIMGLYIGFSILWTLGIFKNKYLKTALITNIIFMLGLGCGRALSFLGFMGDEIATYEEMEQFLETNKQKPSTESSNVNLESEDSDSKVNEIIQDIEKCKSSINPHVLETNLEQIHSRNKDFLLQLQIEDPESFHIIEEKENTLKQQMRSK